MKPIIFKHSIFIFSLFVLSLTQGCEINDNADSQCNGLPVVTHVKYTVLDDSTIHMGNLGDWIIIEGSNFCNIDKIRFNDVWVSMQNVYVEPTLISVSIPRIAPFVENNMITLVTDKNDSIEYPFTIHVPDLKVKGLLNEWAEPGETGYIEGDNFDIHQIDSVDGAWLLFGDVELAVHRMSATRLWFEVPEDALPRTPIWLFRQDTLGNMRVDSLRLPGLYRDNRYILYDGTYNGVDPGTPFTDGLSLSGFPEAVNGTYYYYQGDYSAWAWGGKWRLYTPFNVGQPMSNNGSYDGDWLWHVPTDEVDVVFEVNVINDWTGAEFKINLWDGYAYHWNPHGTAAFHTNGWETVRIPIREFRKPAVTGTPFPASFFEATGNPYWDWKNREVQFHGTANPNTFICWDNLRIVPRYQY